MTFPSSRRSLSAPRPRHVFSALLLGSGTGPDHSLRHAANPGYISGRGHAGG
ncbi:hypothetical protein [Arthrobacter sp. Soil736]|uniref:hypothetical protein n=1 Tax=Arthrobacter sp. Soil736 TaxID=1736395 RepID=UPI000A865F4B|nr:hypothetical protein [Arthrobacter sp. Soil736]